MKRQNIIMVRSMWKIKASNFMVGRKEKGRERERERERESSKLPL
jgi:hypothetical protein